MGIASGGQDNQLFILAGVSAIVAGSLSMAAGEYISVAGQKDSEMADVQKEIEEQNKGPEARKRELQQLTMIFVNTGLTEELASQVAQQLTDKDVIKAHAHYEHGIDLDQASGSGRGVANPLQAALLSAGSFLCGGIIPFLTSAWVPTVLGKIIVLVVVTCIALLGFGVLGAHLGGSSLVRGGLRVFVGGVLALAVSFGVGQIFHVSV